MPTSRLHSWMHCLRVNPGSNVIFCVAPPSQLPGTQPVSHVFTHGRDERRGGEGDGAAEQSASTRKCISPPDHLSDLQSPVMSISDSRARAVHDSSTHALELQSVAWHTRSPFAMVGATSKILVLILSGPSQVVCVQYCAGDRVARCWERF